MTTSRSLPRLTPEVLSDDQKLWEAIELFISSDKELLALGKKVVSLQNQLRGVVDDDGWNKYLRIEELTTARLGQICIKLVRFAFCPH